MIFFSHKPAPPVTKRSRLSFPIGPTIVVPLLAIILIVTNLYLAQHTRPYVSDDVAWQTTFMTWRPHGGHYAFMGGKDNFVTNAPLIWLFGEWFTPTRTLLFVEAAIFAVINAILFYVAFLYFLKKCKVSLNYLTLLPFLWLASFGYSFSELFLNTYWRDFEIGFSFVCFMMVAKLFDREIEPLRSWPSRLATLLFAGLVGLFIFSDPYFLYFTVVPVVGLTGVLFYLKKLSHWQLLVVIGFNLACLIIAKLIELRLHRGGLAIPPTGSVHLISFSVLFSNAALEIKGFLDIFGADFFGLPVASLSAVVALLNFGLIAFTIRGLYRRRPTAWGSVQTTKPGTLWIGFFGALSLLVAIVSLASGYTDYRYFVIVVYGFVLSLALLSYDMRKAAQTLLAGLLMAAIACNLSSSALNFNQGQADAIGNVANTKDYELVQAVEALGLNKGYTGYWNGNISTYLSGGKVHFLPVLCIYNQTAPYHLLIDDVLFRPSVSHSFYLIDPDAYNNPATCSESEVLTQFGPPTQIAKVGDKTIFVYNYDLTSRMGPD